MKDNTKPLVPFVDAESIKEIKKDPKAYLSKFSDIEDNVEVRLVYNKKDCVYFVMPSEQIFDLDLTNVSAARLPPASTAGTASSGSTAGTASSTVSSLSCVGSAGSAACK